MMLMSPSRSEEGWIQETSTERTERLGAALLVDTCSFWAQRGSDWVTAVQWGQSSHWPLPYFTQSCQFSALSHQQSIPQRRRKKVCKLLESCHFGAQFVLCCHVTSGISTFFLDDFWLEFNFSTECPRNSNQFKLIQIKISGVNSLLDEL